MLKSYQAGLSALRWLVSPRDDVAPVLQYSLCPIHGGALDWFDVQTEVAATHPQAPASPQPEAEAQKAVAREEVATLRVSQWPTGREWSVDADEDMLQRLTAGSYRLSVIATSPASPRVAAPTMQAVKVPLTDELVEFIQELCDKSDAETAIYGARDAEEDALYQRAQALIAKAHGIHPTEGERSHD